MTETGTGGAGERRTEQWTLAIGTVVVSVAVALTLVIDDAAWVRLFDNVHWTVGYGTAFVTALLARRRATGVLRRARAWFAAGLGALFVGQLVWDVQVASGWNPFPGPSDAFFSSIGPLFLLGVLDLLRSTSPARRVAIALDGLGMALCVLALVLALYLPRSGGLGTGTLALLTAYPTALVTAGLLALLVAIERREMPSRGLFRFVSSLLVQGALWAEWNRRTLDGTLADGVLLNFLFSYGALYLGAGVGDYEPADRPPSVRVARAYQIVSRSLPLVLVVAAAVALALGRELSPAVRAAVTACMGAVVAVAFARQSLLLEESERLLAVEAKNRELEARLASTQRLEALGTLASGIAHDFNNVLTALLGHAEVLGRDRHLDEPARQAVDGLRTGALRARDVVKRIHAFARSEASAPDDLAVRDVVEEVITFLRAALPAHHDIRAEVPADVAVRAEPVQLHQVLMNLGTNASHAIGERPGTIVFSARRRHGESPAPGLAPGDWVELSVTDDGAGMDGATVARIFDPFFTTKPRGKGTGLGLSVVHGIVVEHGGAIAVDSEPGRGTSMRLYLPAAPFPARERPAQRALAESQELAVPSPVATESGPAPASPGVLIVDDEPVLGRLLVGLLSADGVPAVAETSPKAALELVRAAPDRFAVVVTDMSMPGMTGIELAQEIQKTGSRALLVLSSGTDFVAAGTVFDHVLPKPYTIEDLHAILARPRARATSGISSRS